MVQVNYSTKVCGQLAHEFLTVKAELTKTEVWMIPYEDATDDPFFKCSGLTIELYEGPNAKQKMIEDLTCKRIEEPLYF